MRLEGWSVSDRSRARYRFRRGVLHPGRTLRVRTGRGPKTRGNVYWGRTREVWDDRGDVATLWAPQGRRVQRLAYGRFR